MRQGLSTCIAIDLPVTLRGLVPSVFTPEIVLSLGWADELMSSEEHLLEAIRLTRTGVKKVSLDTVTHTK
ncbi:MAG: hypothetical protein ABIK09_02120 [Pseudomonadota bacterium]